MGRSINIVLLLAISTVLLGCVGPFEKIGVYGMSEVELQGSDTVELAEAYGDSKFSIFSNDDKKFRSELERRNAFTPEQWARIDKNELQPGDDLAFLYASWGRADRSSTTSYSSGSYTCKYYSHSTAKPHVYGSVYLRGSLVDSITR